MSAETRPNITDGVWVCMACHHWQIDVLRRAVSDDPDIWHALASAHVSHQSECPGAEGRINVAGQWVDRPVMTSGKPADTVLGLMPWPRWWVTR